MSYDHTHLIAEVRAEAEALQATIDLIDENAFRDFTPQLYINGEHIAATHFAWDGCHKIYLINSQADRDEMDSFGWDESDYFPITELPQAWDDSCFLRFISWADLTKASPVPQGAEEDGPVSIGVRTSQDQPTTGKLRVYSTGWGTWAVEGGDYYCEFGDHAEAVAEAHRIHPAVAWSGWWTGDGSTIE